MKENDTKRKITLSINVLFVYMLFLYNCVYLQINKNNNKKIKRTLLNIMSILISITTIFYTIQKYVVFFFEVVGVYIYEKAYKAIIYKNVILFLIKLMFKCELLKYT